MLPTQPFYQTLHLQDHAAAFKRLHAFTGNHPLNLQTAIFFFKSNTAINFKCFNLQEWSLSFIFFFVKCVESSSLPIKAVI